MNIIKKIIIFGAIISIMSCAKLPPTKYYILDYNPIIQVGEQLKKPFPYNLQVKNFTIDYTYDNSRIAIRQSTHEIFYDRFSLWTKRPQNAITDLLINHIMKLNMVDNCKKIYLDKTPDYIISGKIHSIEKYESNLPENNFQRADINMSLYLIDAKNKQIILNHEIKSYSPLYTNSMSFFAKIISDTLYKEFDIFLAKLINYFNSINTENKENIQKK